MKKVMSLVALGALSASILVAGCKGEEKKEGPAPEPPKVVEEKAPAPSTAPATTGTAPAEATAATAAAPATGTGTAAPATGAAAPATK